MTTRISKTVISKEKKKKVPSSTKEQQSLNIVNTIKPAVKSELKKQELVGLLARLEGELQGKELVIASLQSQNVQNLLINYRFGLLGCSVHPHGTLMRDDALFRVDQNRESQSIKQNYDTQLTLLKRITSQQKQQIHKLKTLLEETQKNLSSLTEDFENERKEKNRFRSFHNQLVVVQREKSQLEKELKENQSRSKELEEQLIQTTNLLESQHERHKSFLVLFLNERKLENQRRDEQLKQILDERSNNESKWQKKYDDLRNENEREKHRLKEKIKHLESQIEFSTQEKNKKTTNHGGVDPSNSNKTQTNKVDGSSAKEFSSTSNKDRNSVSFMQNAEINSPRSNNSSQHSPRFESHAPMLLRRSSLSSSMFDLSSPPAVTSSMKANFPPNRPKSEHFRSSKTKTPQTSSVESQNENSTSEQNKKPKNSGNAERKASQMSQNPESQSEELKFNSKNLNSAAETRITFSPTSNNRSSSSQSEIVLLRAAETGDSAQLFKCLKQETNPDCQSADGNTSLHFALSNGHIECIRHLLKFGANPNIENHQGFSSWKILSRLNEKLQLECLHELVEAHRATPPIHLIADAIEHNQTEIYDYLFALMKDKIQSNQNVTSDLVRAALRSSNTHFLTSTITLSLPADLIRSFVKDGSTSVECLKFLEKNSKTTEEKVTKSRSLNVFICSSKNQHHYSHAIGKIPISPSSSWCELEKSCMNLFTDHMTQIDSALGSEKSNGACSTLRIDTITLGQTSWTYRDSPNDNQSNPFTSSKVQDTINIHLKSFSNNSNDSLAYNYFVPNQHLKQYFNSIEQNKFVAVYGPAYSQKKEFFADLIRCFELPTAVSSVPKFRVITFEIELVTNEDEIVEELIEQKFFYSDLPSLERCEAQLQTKVLLYFPNIQNMQISRILDILMNSETIKDRYCKTTYAREDDSGIGDRLEHPTTDYYFTSNFHLVVTLSKRIWPTDNELYKRFHVIPLKLEKEPWNGQLKRHLLRRMIHHNILENRGYDEDLIKMLQWISNVWQRYNESLSAAHTPDAILGPAIFLDCPMERQSIFEWLQNKWNSIIAPMIRDHSITRSSSARSKTLNNTTSEDTASPALYVLLQRAVSRECPLAGTERDQYLTNFTGYRVGGGPNSSGSLSSMSSSGTPNRTSTPQQYANPELISVQLE